MPEEVESYPAWAAAWVKILVILLVTAVIVFVMKKLLRYSADKHRSLFHKYFINMIEVVVILCGTLLAIGQIPQLSRVAQTVLAGSGILALALSLAAQESLNNLISGLFIALFKPFEVGDRIILVNSKISGLVEDITLRHTIIKTYTNTRVVVPNSTMNKEILENSHLIDAKASSFVDVTVAYESDIDKAMAIMAQVIGDHPAYLDVRKPGERDTQPKVKVFVRALGESGVALRANMWTKTVNENFEACSDIRLQLKKAFNANGIEIPYTKYTILHQEREEK